MKKLSASPEGKPTGQTLRELGRVERSLSMIECYSSPALRRRSQARSSLMALRATAM
ncbi:Tn3 family transposase [Mesorhizobium norvegicum]|uniref:Tn3 family transposase n=1 Tax=Mesorhizobium TaxID=68287 RepID=UPI003CCC5A6C